MKKIFEIARWEFIEKVKTKTFIISLILTPAILIIFSVTPTLLSEQETSQTKVIGLIDTSETYITGLKEELSKYKLNDVQPSYLSINLTTKNKSLNDMKKYADNDVIEEKIEGYLLILNGGTDSVAIDYRSKSSGNLKDIKRFEVSFNDIRIKLKLNKENINPQILIFFHRPGNKF